eukprot:TRINITY_DN16703_c0_g1_i1.p2 TRINITY_DN16703_c0_g1~~TRINITY_DN16703_c0_g1_i1.p2  ORF type:complete len:108 (-),score=36.63 TRINITY_DN16703_c0_g1_i1:57-380(-)
MCIRDRFKILGPTTPAHIVSAEPEVKVVECTPQDRFIILACDGVWDVLTDQQACHIVLEHMAVSYTHLRAHETPEHLVCRLLLEKKKKQMEHKENKNVEREKHKEER